MDKRFERKANKLHWVVKGRLITFGESEETIKKIHNSYFKRVWGNHEAMTETALAGFEEAWQARQEEWPDFDGGDM